MKRFVFVSGLPRAGSTLLMNVLAQNPDFHVTHTSGCLDVLFGLRNQWDHLIEHRAHPLPETKQRVLRAVLEAYHAGTDKPVVFDKSRGWLAHLEMLEEILGGKAKVIVLVRAIPDVLASFEKLHRQTAKTAQPPGEAENYFQMQTVEGRCEYWLRPDNVLGLALNRVRDVLQRGLGDRLHFVAYEQLIMEPATVMENIYGFLGEPQFAHDFDHVEQVTHEDDDLHGYAGLHTIRPKIEPRESDAVAVLGKNLVQKYRGNLQ